MSIIGLIGILAAWRERLIVAAVLAATVAGIAIFIASRAYRARTIRGPQRLPDEEPLGPFVFIMLGGMSLWMFVPALILKLNHRGVRIEDVKAGPRETVILGIIGGVVPFFFMMLGTLTRRERGLETLGFARRNFRESIFAALAGSVFVIPLIGWVAVFSDWLMRRYQIEHPMKHELLKIMDEAPGVTQRLLIGLSAVVVAPLFEEFLFRGHLQTLLARVTRRPWLSVFVTSCVFALAHPWFTWLPIFVLSICLGYMYERTGNLWVSVLMHAAFNGCMIVLNWGSR
jgi:membrane protease YdiL (CAAX protease family)